VGGAINRLGYDRDFPLIAGGLPGAVPEAVAVPGWQSVVLDAGRSTVRLEPGTLLDLGATAKAWAADRAAAAIAEQVGCGVLVSLGGDIAVRRAPAGGFPIGIADICGEPDAPTAVAIESGGLATSGVGSRHWTLGARAVHHLVDPSSGLPVDVTWRTVSVAAGSCVDANTASTASMVLGSEAVPWLEGLGLPARLVAPDGRVVTVADWPADSGRPAQRSGTGGASPVRPPPSPGGPVGRKPDLRVLPDLSVKR
jgi:thiamine biosynthesis lipoprotein